LYLWYNISHLVNGHFQIRAYSTVHTTVFLENTISSIPCDPELSTEFNVVGIKKFHQP
jgi:hypothetical protein